MVMVLIIESILAFVVFGLTTLCAAPIVFRLASGARWLTRLLLSFILGFAFISLSGILSSFWGLDPVILQAGIMLFGMSAFLRDRNMILGNGKEQRLDQDDWMALAIASIYLFLSLIFMDRIVIWMGGDALAHAELIRMLLDGRSVPVSIPPMGSYWEYYPKGFHFFAYPWARVAYILDVLRAVPILLTTVTPMLLYSAVREMGRRNDAIYALILSCFVFPAHYSNLIWAGYPTIAAEMLLVAAVLATLVDKRILPIILLGLLFAHGRMIILAGAVFLVWQSGSRFKYHRRSFGAGLGFMVLLMAGYLVFFGHSPEFLISVFTKQSMTAEYAARWYPAFLSLFGAAIAILRREEMDRLALSWSGAVILVVLLADSSPLGFVGSADRQLLGLYLPLSLLAAFALSSMVEGVFIKRARVGFILILLICGTSGMVAVYSSYAHSWAIPKEDFQAITWLGEQDHQDTFCINLDETGAWIYPLTGIMVAKSRFLEAGAPFDQALISKIIVDPGSREVTEALGRMGCNRSLIYISNVSLSRPGYIPPFADYLGAFPELNLNYTEDSYELIYSRGARIYEFSGKNFV